MKCIVAVGLLAAGLVSAAPAYATDLNQSVTVVLTWSPAGCIHVTVPAAVRTHVEQSQRCQETVGATMSTYTVAPGQWYGIDPDERADPHHYYVCTVSISGREVIKQSGWAVDCLRQFA